MTFSQEAKKNFKVNKKIQEPITVHYTKQTWQTFDVLPNDGFGGHGPTGVNLWLYFPADKYISAWKNWSGSPNDIINLKKQKVMWCYATKPDAPILN